MNNLKKEKGFTIIEVVLVLAIAALIFLMVFIALPALQRNQRDTQRKNDLGRLQTAVTNYAGSHSGNLPTLNAAFITSYLTVGGDSFVDPNGTAYSFAADAGGDTVTFSDGAQIRFVKNRVCDENGVPTATGAGPRKVSFRIGLEGGGSHCVNN